VTDLVIYSSILSCVLYASALSVWRFSHFAGAYVTGLCFTGALTLGTWIWFLNVNVNARIVLFGIEAPYPTLFLIATSLVILSWERITKQYGIVSNLVVYAVLVYAAMIKNSDVIPCLLDTSAEEGLRAVMLALMLPSFLICIGVGMPTLIQLGKRLASTRFAIHLGLGYDHLLPVIGGSFAYFLSFIVYSAITDRPILLFAGYSWPVIVVYGAVQLFFFVLVDHVIFILAADELIFRKLKFAIPGYGRLLILSVLWALCHGQGEIVSTAFSFVVGFIIAALFMRTGTVAYGLVLNWITVAWFTSVR